MPLNVEFNYPAPVPQPRPVKAVLDGSLSINLSTNEVTSAYYEHLQRVDANGTSIPDGTPRRGAERKVMRVYLSDAQLQQIIGIIGAEVEVQGSLVAGSSSIITTK